MPVSPGHRRSGFTLVELLIGIVILGIVGAAIMSLLVRSQRLARTQADRSVMQANVRAGMGLVTSELREISISATASDISALSSTSITYRGQRGLGFVCEKNANYVIIARGTFSGYRDPLATDGALVFVDNDVDSATDDGWTRRTLSSVATETCSSGGAGIRLNFATAIPTSPTDSLAMIQVGSPVRTFEDMEIGALVQGGQTWLAARSISAGQAFQPVLGPLSSGGVNFVYLNSAGTAGATALTVRNIRLTLTGITDNIVAAQAGPVAWTRASDQLITTIQLRNTP